MGDPVRLRPGNGQNCVKACPKEIPLTEAIVRSGRQTTLHGLKKFFTASDLGQSGSVQA